MMKEMKKKHLRIANEFIDQARKGYGLERKEAAINAMMNAQRVATLANLMGEPASEAGKIMGEARKIILA